MSHETKGFFMTLPSIFPRSGQKQGISFQLRPTGVRYFYLGSSSVVWGSQEQKPRDISTQYGSLVYLVYGRSARGRLALSPANNATAERRLIAHAEKFYPGFVIPDDRLHETYAWVAFPMLGAAMKRADSKPIPPVSVNLQVASGLRAFSIEEMVGTIFGEAPRQLQTAAAESLTRGTQVINIDNLTLASLLRGYLPPNELAAVLRMNLGSSERIQNIDKQSANEVRLLLRRFNSKRLMRMVSGLEEETGVGFRAYGYMLLRDAARQYADARKNHPDVVMDLSRQFRSFQELHDTITHEYRKLKDPNRDILYQDDLLDRLSDITLPDGAKLVWPSCTHELVDWASDKAMNNCIYSYGKDAAEGRCLLLGIVDSSGKMVVNVMVRGRNVVQCYGKANSVCEDEAQIEALFQGLIENKIINEESDHKQWTRRRW